MQSGTIGIMDRTPDKIEASRTTVTTQARATTKNPNQKNDKKKMEMVLKQSNAGSATKQGTLRWNAEKRNP